MCFFCPRNILLACHSETTQVTGPSFFISSTLQFFSDEDGDFSIVNY